MDLKCPECRSNDLGPSKVEGYAYCKFCGRGSIPLPPGVSRRDYFQDEVKGTLFYEDILKAVEEIKSRKEAIRQSLPEEHRAILDASLCLVHPESLNEELRQLLHAFGGAGARIDFCSSGHVDLRR